MSLNTNKQQLVILLSICGILIVLLSTLSSTTTTNDLIQTLLRGRAPPHDNNTEQQYIRKLNQHCATLSPKKCKASSSCQLSTTSTWGVQQQSCEYKLPSLQTLSLNNLGVGGSGSGSGSTMNSYGAHCAYMTNKQCKKSNNCYLVGVSSVSLGVCVHGVDPNINNNNNNGGSGSGSGGQMVQLSNNGGSQPGSGGGGGGGGGGCAKLNKKKCKKSRECTYNKRFKGCVTSLKKKKVVSWDVHYLRGEEEEEEETFANAAAAIIDEPSFYQEEEEEGDGSSTTLCVTGSNAYELSQLDPNHPTSDCGPTSFCYIQQPNTCPETTTIEQQPMYGICKSKPKTCTEEYIPVCGCDGLIHGNVCMAHREGVNVILSNTVVDAENAVCGASVDSSGAMNDEDEVISGETEEEAAQEVSMLPISTSSEQQQQCTTNNDCSNGLTCHISSGQCTCNTITNEGCYGGQICTSNPPGLYCPPQQQDDGGCLPTCTCDYNSPFPAMYVNSENNDNNNEEDGTTTTNGCNIGEVCRQPCAMADGGPQCFTSEIERDCNIYGIGYVCRSNHGGMGCILLEEEHEEDSDTATNNNDDCSTKNKWWHISLIPGVNNTCTNDDDYPVGWEKLNDGIMYESYFMLYESSKECCIGNGFGNALECNVIDVCSLSIGVVQSDGGGGGEEDDSTTTGATTAADTSTIPLQDCPIEGHCRSPSGICGPRVQCLTNPCDNTTCEDGQVCMSQNCGGCHSICVVSTTTSSSSTSVIPSDDATSTVVTSTTSSSSSSSSSSKMAYWYPQKDDITHTKRCTYDANYPDEYATSSIQELLSLSEDECCQNYPEACQQHQHTIGPINNKEEAKKWYPHELDDGTRICAYDSNYPTEYTNPELDPPILFDDEVDCCVAFDVCQNDRVVSATTSSTVFTTTTAISVSNDTETTTSTVGATEARSSAYSTTCEWHISTEPYVHNTCTNSGYYPREWSQIPEGFQHQYFFATAEDCCKQTKFGIPGKDCNVEDTCAEVEYHQLDSDMIMNIVDFPWDFGNPPQWKVGKMLTSLSTRGTLTNILHNQGPNVTSDLTLRINVTSGSSASLECLAMIDTSMPFEYFSLRVDGQPRHVWYEEMNDITEITTTFGLGEHTIVFRVHTASFDPGFNRTEHGHSYGNGQVWLDRCQITIH